MINTMINSNEITLNFSELTVQLTVGDNSETYAKGEPELQHAITALFDKVTNVFMNKSDIINIKGPGLIATNISKSSTTNYYLVPHRFKTFIMDSSFYAKLKWNNSFDETLFKSLNSDTYSAEIFTPPMILIISTQGNRLTSVYGGYIKPEYYNFITCTLNIETADQFNELVLYSEISNQYNDSRFCLSLANIKPTYEAVLHAIDWGINNTDLFDSNSIKGFMDRIYLATRLRRVTIEDMINICDSAVGYSTSNPISSIVPLIDKGN